MSERVARDHERGDAVIKFESTRKVYEVANEGGYSFQVVLAKGTDGGWDAQMFIRTFAMKDESSALRKLADDMERYAKMLREAAP